LSGTPSYDLSLFNKAELWLDPGFNPRFGSRGGGTIIAGDSNYCNFFYSKIFLDFSFILCLLWRSASSSYASFSLARTCLSRFSSVNLL